MYKRQAYYTCCWGQLLAIFHRSQPSRTGYSSPPGDPLRGQRKWLLSPYHAVHQDEFEIVFIKRLVPVSVVSGPDVTGDGCGDPGVGIPVTRVGQQRSLVIQQPGEGQGGIVTCSARGVKGLGPQRSPTTDASRKQGSGLSVSWNVTQATSSSISLFQRGAPRP